MVHRAEVQRRETYVGPLRSNLPLGSQKGTLFGIHNIPTHMARVYHGVVGTDDLIAYAYAMTGVMPSSYL